MSTSSMRQSCHVVCYVTSDSAGLAIDCICSEIEISANLLCQKFQRSRPNTGPSYSSFVWKTWSDPAGGPGPRTIARKRKLPPYRIHRAEPITSVDHMHATRCRPFQCISHPPDHPLTRLQETNSCEAALKCTNIEQLRGLGISVSGCYFSVLA